MTNATETDRPQRPAWIVLTRLPGGEWIAAMPAFHRAKLAQSEARVIESESQREAVVRRVEVPE